MTSPSRYAQSLAVIEAELRARFDAAANEFGQSEDAAPDVALGPARDPAHGDFASAAALAAGKKWKRNPLEIAQKIAAAGTDRLPGVGTIEAKAPGFINLRMAQPFWGGVVAEALERGADFGRSDALSETGPVLLEFVSANPTGPLNVVQGRSSSLGATLAGMLRFAGADVKTETYVNDSGAQLDLLADSLYARYATLCGVPTAVPDDGYQGDDISEVARQLQARDGDRWLKAAQAERRAALGAFARDVIVEQQRRDLENFGVVFDRWFFESSLYAGGKVDEVVDWLLQRGVAYEKDGAIWLRSTQFGDDKDRVLRRSDGRPTYLAPDAAYHRDKFERGNRYLIDIFGPDHHGYVARISAIAAALGHPGKLEVLIAQQVTLKRGAETVAMSKRAGHVVTLREVVDEVGKDAARFFFINRAPESQLIFDLSLAVEQSTNNPVYYVQYGHARIASIVRKAEETGRGALLERARRGADLERLEHRTEIALIRRLTDFARTVGEAARARAPHRLAEYARDVATDFHAFYTECVVLGDDEALSSARLSLALASKTVLASALTLLGVSAPDRM
ncbi:MAG: arginine--tRNA ligase [Candidatus Eremiobacteraeota bacterium]|nr:arginine--tRNA ligase [Candidatus Eremiobacteraeota bacterium]MBV8365253.1 arginine--tRNA ligase [Candidatus Eremiobacteraeota bacterium]